MNSGKLVFSQMMAHLSLQTFRQCVAKYPSHYPTLTSSHLNQFFNPAFAKLTYCESQCDIKTWLRAHQAKLYHLGSEAISPRAHWPMLTAFIKEAIK